MTLPKTLAGRINYILIFCLSHPWESHVSLIISDYSRFHYKFLPLIIIIVAVLLPIGKQNNLTAIISESYDTPPFTADSMLLQQLLSKICAYQVNDCCISNSDGAYLNNTAPHLFKQTVVQTVDAVTCFVIYNISDLGGAF